MLHLNSMIGLTVTWARRCNARQHKACAEQGRAGGLIVSVAPRCLIASPVITVAETGCPQWQHGSSGQLLGSIHWRYAGCSQHCHCATLSAAILAFRSSFCIFPAACEALFHHPDLLVPIASRGAQSHPSRPCAVQCAGSVTSVSNASAAAFSDADTAISSAISTAFAAVNPLAWRRHAANNHTV